MSDTPNLDHGLAEIDRMMRQRHPDKPQDDNTDEPVKPTRREKKRRQKEARIRAQH